MLDKKLPIPHCSCFTHKNYRYLATECNLAYFTLLDGHDKSLPTHLPHFFVCSDGVDWRRDKKVDCGTHLALRLSFTQRTFHRSRESFCSAQMPERVAHLKKAIGRARGCRARSCNELCAVTQPTADRLLIRTLGTNDRDCRRNDTLVAFHVIHTIVFGRRAAAAAATAAATVAAACALLVNVRSSSTGPMESLARVQGTRERKGEDREKKEDA